MSYDYYTTGYDNSSQIGGLIAGYATAALIVGLIATVFGIIVMWKIFQKAGKPGWAAIVPFYNMYVLFEITWGKGWMFLTMFVAIIPIVGYIAALVIIVLTMIKLAKAFGKDTGFAVGLILLGLIFMGILAFDSSEYLGVPSKDGSVNATPNPQPMPNNNMVSGPQQPVNPNPTFGPQQPMNQVGTCPNCGTQLQPGTEFCPNCGNKITN